jgi:hypothetical protein
MTPCNVNTRERERESERSHVLCKTQSIACFIVLSPISHTLVRLHIPRTSCPLSSDLSGLFVRFFFLAQPSLLKLTSRTARQTIDQNMLLQRVLRVLACKNPLLLSASVIWGANFLGFTATALTHTHKVVCCLL